MKVTATTTLPADTDADAVVIGLIDGEEIHHDPGGALAELVASGEAKPSFKHLATTHAVGKRWILVGLGRRDELDDERLRVAASTALARAREIGVSSLCWELPHRLSGTPLHPAAAIVEGTLLSAYRYSLKRDSEDETEADSPDIDRLLLSDHDDQRAAVQRAVLITEAVNRARDLQNAPANLMTPTTLAERAQRLADGDRLTVEVGGRERIAELGMGAFGAVAQGSYEDPKLIVLRYEPPEPTPGSPIVGFVGKAVTFDSGGISIKPAAKMQDMKFDMSGGAAVIEAIGAIAALELPVRVIGVVGATENLPSGRSVKPGDVVTAANGLTIEVNNTDAEGRLVLADCLTHARSLGAERLVDVATLTGAVLVALGSTYTGLIGNDDEWCERIVAAGAGAGELLWRLPMHAEYAEAVKGSIADLVNAPESRKAGTITGAQFLAPFVDDLPWAHLDIAGTAWDTAKPYTGKGPTGSMVRTLVALADGCG